MSVLRLLYYLVFFMLGLDVGCSLLVDWDSVCLLI